MPRTPKRASTRTTKIATGFKLIEEYPHGLRLYRCETKVWLPNAKDPVNKFSYAVWRYSTPTKSKQLRRFLYIDHEDHAEKYARVWIDGYLAALDSLTP